MAPGMAGRCCSRGDARAASTVDALDLGEHRLKDFDEPVRALPARRRAVPAAEDDLEHEPAAAGVELRRPRAGGRRGRSRCCGDGARLVTLTGPGGIGKTRLAIEAAAELVGEFKAGVFWVGLAPLRDPALVVETIAQTLGAKGELAAHIGEREMLLVLDNLEQVIEAAPSSPSSLEACPNLALLVTCRELLRVRGEVEYQVHPLAEPEAVELFCARAQARAERRRSSELCRPARQHAARARARRRPGEVLSPSRSSSGSSQRLDLLQGRPRRRPAPADAAGDDRVEPRPALAEDEQRLFARLAVFAGGCTLEAAEEVCDADLDTLQSLVDKSLLRRTGDRFWMLETIREYALERLDASPRGKEAVERRHTDFFLALAREAEIGERGPDQIVWWDRLEQDLDNIRKAIDRAGQRGDHVEELELAALLKNFWHVRGHLREGGVESSARFGLPR